MVGKTRAFLCVLALALAGACAGEAGPDISTDLLEAKTGCPTGKVAICHYPPGNPDNMHSLCVGESAVDAHVRNHEDTLGFCDGVAVEAIPEPGICGDLDSSASVPSEASGSSKSGSSKSGSGSGSAASKGSSDGDRIGYKSSGNSRSASGSRESHSDSNCDGDSDSSEAESAPSKKSDKASKSSGEASKSKSEKSKDDKYAEGAKAGVSGQSGSESSGSDNSDSLSLEFSGEDPDCVPQAPVDMPAVDCTCGNPGLSSNFYCSAVEVFACDGIDSVTLVYADGAEVEFSGVTGNTGLFLDEGRAGMDLQAAYITSGGITQELVSDAAGCTNF